MEYQGRSPLAAITRSVVLGAAMIPPALLASCHHDEPTTPPTGGGGGSGNTASNDTDGGTQAPPPDVVRPRNGPENINTMPTRGFSGGSRARR